MSPVLLLHLLRQAPRFVERKHGADAASLEPSMDHVCKHIDMKQPAAAVAVSVKRYAATTPVQCAWKRYAALTQVHSVRISGMPLLHRCTVCVIAQAGKETREAPQYTTMAMRDSDSEHGTLSAKTLIWGECGDDGDDDMSTRAYELDAFTQTAVAVPGFVETLRFYLGTAIGIKLLNTQCSVACL